MRLCKTSRNTTYRRTLAITVCCLIFGNVVNPWITAKADVIPQEGWYIAGETNYTRNGKNIAYWIIDNKVGLDPWYFDTEFSYRRTASYDTNLSNYGEFFARNPSMWHGYSDYDWFLDSDWLVRVWPVSGSVKNQGQQLTTDDSTFGIVLFDYSRLPTVYNCISSSNGNVDFVYDYSDSLIFYNEILCENALTFNAWNVIAPDSTGFRYTGIADGYHTSGYLDASNCSINDLAIFGYCYDHEPTGTSANLIDIEMRFAVQFMVPKDKCPNGLKIGDRWPQVRTFKVEIEGEIQDYQTPYSEALASKAQVSASGVANRYDEYKGYTRSQFTKLPDVGSSSKAVSSFQSFFKVTPFYTVLVAFVPFIVVCIFIKKGLS